MWFKKENLKSCTPAAWGHLKGRIVTKWTFLFARRFMWMSEPDEKLWYNTALSCCLRRPSLVWKLPMRSATQIWRGAVTSQFQIREELFYLLISIPTQRHTMLHLLLFCSGGHKSATRTSKEASPIPEGWVWMWGGCWDKCLTLAP